VKENGKGKGMQRTNAGFRVARWPEGPAESRRDTRVRQVWPGDSERTAPAPEPGTEQGVVDEHATTSETDDSRVSQGAQKRDSGS